jgi:hypothetical protein
MTQGHWANATIAVDALADDAALDYNDVEGKIDLIVANRKMLEDPAQLAAYVEEKRAAYAVAKKEAELAAAQAALAALQP